jgi:pimeloyl-ACP methyl ester carboxylesterase
LVDFSVDAGCPSDLRQRIRDMHLVVGQHSTRADYAACNAFDVMDRIDGIAVPTLIVVGSNDRMTPPKYAKFLNERIKASRLLVVEASGHMPHFERPAAVNAAIAELV